MDKEKIVEIIVEELKKLGFTIVSKKEETQKMYKSGFFTQKNILKVIPRYQKVES
jgi:2-polyprenyl-3-methyl-5-hydroxy-6-metoxy-1,4-benzoquinol methylase